MSATHAPCGSRRHDGGIQIDRDQAATDAGRGVPANAQARSRAVRAVLRNDMHCLFRHLGIGLPPATE
jgi:hypothetical protein